MVSRLLRALSTLDLEERILNGGALIGLIGVFLPWLSGEWLGGNPITYSGFSFYTSFLGIGVFALYSCVLVITLSPLAGGPVIIRKRNRETVRLCIASLATILVLASLSVLTKVTFEFSRIEVRFGIYVSLIGGLVATLYAFLKLQAQQKQEVHDLFHHPEDQLPLNEPKESMGIPPPPPPPPLPSKPEEHRLRPLAAAYSRSPTHD